MKILTVLLVLAFMLPACTEPDAASIATICKALVGPIRYNSKESTSVYYAGKKLVITLKQRNAVWIGLKCKV